MSKIVIPFSAFLEAAGAEHFSFIDSLHEFLTENECTTEIKEAKNGYVLSYKHKPSKRVVTNYVFRKKGLMMRIYADNILSYSDILAKWPESMKKDVKKAGVCKRLVCPDDCNPRCPLGYDFILDGERQQKCRYGLMFYLTDETKPYLHELIKLEMQRR